jgi:hypothetical protein
MQRRRPLCYSADEHRDRLGDDAVVPAVPITRLQHYKSRTANMLRYIPAMLRVAPVIRLQRRNPLQKSNIWNFGKM